MTLRAKKKISDRLGCALIATAALLGVAAPALADDKPAAAAAPAAMPAASTATAAPATAAPAKDVKDERALRLLKAMSDKLAAAKTLGFKIRGIVPTPSPTGQYVSLFASSRVLMQRPDRLFVAARGDLFPSDIFFDGKTVTAIGVDNRFYTQRDAAGGAIEALMQNVQPGSDATAPFLDILVPDPYGVLTKDFASAFWIGRTMVGGVETDHLAFTAPGLDWEIWIGVADKLPRLLVVSYRTGERQPTFTVEFSEWKLNAPVPAGTFVAKIPKGATRLEFKQAGQTN
jgi:hypothetical protein